MRIVIDTNIAFSAILNSNARLAKIILQPRSRFNFYSTDLLLAEIEEHRTKIKRISKYTEADLKKIITLITNRIRFIDVRLIPKDIFQKSFELTKDVDVDDTEFIALTEHIRGRLWSGDKELLSGLKRKGWNKFISTAELYRMIY
jgi:predicted nucleic acid-binding protein